ncbi:hypothetical protein KDH_66060 [Dictyobacter sp. S3.2.2.5]|uniref:non-specific serine/threonine protein kinase n=1 Tax=Dictyobacter halimunensis TaxID=3026934 RepID=A0ABQ6G3F7_9CHLR|nr:hypothetical protein KDH_66060 [Dictyobacter sp. S3.2.2.5]
MIKTQIGFWGDRYQILDPIGRGGMARIYQGRDLLMDRVVAMKVLREVYMTDPSYLAYFQREAKITLSLRHPNIVQALDYVQNDGNYFLVMELIEGADLGRYLRSRGVLPVDRVTRIAHDVALGLGAAHRRNIVHRGVKPQEIMIGRDGSIKIIDFSLASDLSQDRHTEDVIPTEMAIGMVSYCAPEQARNEIVSPAADVYALGVVMYMMLTGRAPFDGETPVEVTRQHMQDAPPPPSQFNPHIPRDLENIILRCLEKEPEKRYHDGNALAHALKEFNDTI